MEYKLRFIQEKDAEGMLDWMHDSKINYFYTDKIRNATKEDVLQFIQNAERQRMDGTTYHYAVVDEQDEYLGTISLKNIEPVKGAEYAISMRGKYHGQGIASWATREILRIAFEQLNLHRVYLNVLSDNEHANHFYRQNGFRLEGQSKDCILIDGRIKSLNWYAMLKDEMLSQRKELEHGTI